MRRDSVGGRVRRLVTESLSARIVASFLGLAVVVVGLVAAAAFGLVQRSLSVGAMARLDAIAALKERELDRWVGVQRDRLVLLGGLPGVREEAVRATRDHSDAAVAALSEVVGRGGAIGSDVLEMFFLSPVGGRVVASSDEARVGAFHVEDLFFQEGMNGTFVQNVYLSPVTGRPTLTVATPVTGAAGLVNGVLVAHLNLSRLDAILDDRAGLGETAHAYLVTPSNDLVSSERFGRPEFRRGVSTEAVSRALAGETGTARYEDYDGHDVLGAFRWLEERQLALIVEISAEEAFAPARAMLVAILFVGTAATLALLFGVRQIARRVSSPLVELAEGAARVASGDFTAELAAPGRDEIGKLGRAFNTMTGRLRHLYGDLQGQIEATNRALAAVREGQQLLRAIVDNSSALIAVSAPAGELVLANHALEEALGWERGKGLGRSLATSLDADTAGAFAESHRRVLAESVVVEGELVLGGAAEPRTFLSVVFPLKADGGTVFATGMIATEITERLEAEEERKRFEAQLRHTQKLESLGVLAGGIAHDFNNILAAILGHADLAREAEGDEVQEHLEQVVNAAERAANLTNQMLAYAGRASLHVEVLDVNEAVRNLWPLLTVSTKKKVALEQRLSTDPCQVEADPAQLTQVIMNLVTNAAQAIGDDAGTVTIETGLLTLTDGAPDGVRAGRYVGLTVRDTGCGMDESTLERIFDPFFSTKEAGRGLGLAAVMGIVHGLDGAVRVQSTPGKGTRFEILVPATSAVTSEVVHTLELAPAACGSATVLLVDDEPTVRDFARKSLERAGYTVLEAGDGVSALERWRERGSEISALVLDVSMPGMSGPEVFVEVRRGAPDLPAVFMTGYDPSDAVRGLETDGRVRLLQKPFRMGDLTAAVGELT